MLRIPNPAKSTTTTVSCGIFSSEGIPCPTTIYFFHLVCDAADAFRQYLAGHNDLNLVTAFQQPLQFLFRHNILIHQAKGASSSTRRSHSSVVQYLLHNSTRCGY